MINIKGQKDYLVALESVAMTDIVLNMFIFFFISFSILYTFNPERVSKVEVSLPKAKSAIALEGEEKLTLAITRRGEYFLNDEMVKTKGLKEALSERLKDNPAAGVILKVDRSARFDAVSRALDVMNEIGLKNVSVAALKRE